MRRVRFAEKADVDLEAIADYIAKDAPAGAKSFVRELRTRCLALGPHPFQGRPEREIGPDARLLLFRSYVVLYRVTPDEVVVNRVVHGARDLDILLGQDDDD